MANLVAEDHEKGKEDARSQGCGQGCRGDPVQNGFGAQNGPIPKEPILDGPHDGHGTYAKKKACGEETLGQRSSVEPFFHPAAPSLQMVGDAQRPAQTATEDHGKKKDENVLGF